MFTQIDVIRFVCGGVVAVVVDRSGNISCIAWIHKDKIPNCITFNKINFVFGLLKVLDLHVKILVKLVKTGQCIHHPNRNTVRIENLNCRVVPNLQSREHNVQRK